MKCLVMPGIFNTVFKRNQGSVHYKICSMKFCIYPFFLKITLKKNVSVFPASTNPLHFPRLLQCLLPTVYGS